MENKKLVDIESTLNNSDLSDEATDEILRLFSEKNVSLQKMKKENNLTEEQLKIKILDEPDWRKRASLSAMLISKSLNN